MPTQDDIQFAELAVKKEFTSKEKVTDCINELTERWERVSLKKPLYDLMIDKGVLSIQQVNEILKLQGKNEQLVKGYTLLEILGRGGLGVVYKARQEGIGRIVALKVMAPDLCNNPDYVQRFMLEARICAQLDHPNIVRGIDFGETQGTYYFAMEFVEGKSLKNIIEEKGRMEEGQAVEIFCEMAEALKHLEEHALVHRDIKPDNIIINKEGVPKLCDLGLAKGLETNNLALTQAGMVVGTPFYISPEQAMGEELDVRSDIYSLGVTLYHLVTGRVPFIGGNAMSIISKHLAAPFPNPRDYNPNISEQLSAVILKMTAKKRTDRYQTSQELIVDLNRLRKGSTPLVSKKTGKAIKPGEISKNITEDVTQNLKIDSDVQQISENDFRTKKIEESIKIQTDLIRQGIENAGFVRDLDKLVKLGDKKETPSKRRITARPFILIFILIFLSFVWYKSHNRIFDILKSIGVESSDKDTDTYVEENNNPNLIDCQTSLYYQDKTTNFQEELKKIQILSKKRNSEDIKKDMIFIKGGIFNIGSNEDHLDECSREINISPFWIDVHEVTNSQYREFCKATGHRVPKEWPDDGGATSGMEDYPVVGVSWYDACLYAAWLGKRLPTEEEWEIAARGTERKIYPWGDHFESSMANLGTEMIEPATKREKINGLYNMIGNVLEWTSSPYDRGATIINNVVKGGSYMTKSSCARASYRDAFYPWTTRRDLGFRCVLSHFK